ncbi:hypothetical protein B0T21DRAFT_348647 [Apiosordaria backusii]|uniref:Uncharacterized protein n=1 Tax=Apiosordaria backusii TaxID=314023 RepID=A0AA40EHW3_9PEZI|nr:hypothetical protein B0T21DRAFT_348647 [Apiosordaria backusii]
MTTLRSLSIFTLAALPAVVQAWLPDPDIGGIHGRDAISNDPYPYCNPTTSANCILNGLYLFPTLEFSNQTSLGNQEFINRLPVSSSTISVWTNNKIPQTCYYWGVTRDSWTAAGFTVYNVTYSDCGTPFVVCRHSTAPKSITEIATEIGRIPIKLRQSTSVYLVYGDWAVDNPAYAGYMAALGQQGLIVGRSKAYFPSALLHEVTHTMDSSILSPAAPNPWGIGTAYSASTAFRSAVNADGYAVAGYGTNSYSENSAEAGRAIMLDVIYPGGLVNFTGNNPNLTQLDNTLNAVRTAAGSYYVTGGTCDSTKKFPYPTVWRMEHLHGGDHLRFRVGLSKRQLIGRCDIGLPNAIDRRSEELNTRSGDPLANGKVKG